MKQQATQFKTLDLPSGTLVPFPSVRGERVRVLSGRVWLTEEGDPNDEFLASGQEVALGGQGLAVIEALTAARVQLVEPQSLWSDVKSAARQAALALSELWLTPPRQPSAASRDLRLAQALAQFDGSLGLVQRVKVESGCTGREQALA